MAFDTIQDLSVQHTLQDNIESLFYVTLWIMVMYDGPSGLEQGTFNFNLSILGQWTEAAINNLDITKDSKQSLFTEFTFDFKPSSITLFYFHDPIPLVKVGVKYPVLYQFVQRLSSCISPLKTTTILGRRRSRHSNFHCQELM